MKKLLTTTIALIILIAASGYARAEKSLRFGVNPWATEPEMRRIFGPLMEYIGDQLDINIIIVIPTSYDDLLKRTARGEIDIAAFNAVSYLRARRGDLPLRYIATLLRKEKGEKTSRDYYTGYIVVRKDSPYKTLDDLKGKTFAFVEPDSGSGYKMPAALLATTGRGSPGEFFKKYFFVGDHDEVMSAIYHKSVDGGATWDNSYNLNTSNKRFGKAFRIIRRISPIPNDAWVTGPKVDPATAEKLKSILLSIDDNTRTADGRKVIDYKNGFPGNGWSERSPEFYEKQAKLLLYSTK